MHEQPLRDASDGAPRMNEGLKITDKDTLGSRAALSGSSTVGTAGRSSAQLIVGAHRPREASTGGSLTPVTALNSSIVLTNPHKPASETNIYYSLSSTIRTSRVCMWEKIFTYNTRPPIVIFATCSCAPGSAGCVCPVGGDTTTWICERCSGNFAGDEDFKSAAVTNVAAISYNNLNIVEVT